MNIEVINGVKVSKPQDCGNAPKKMVLVGLYQAFAACDFEHIWANITEDLRWNIVGWQVLRSHDDALDLLGQCRVAEGGLKEITILNVITHGNVCAVEGEMLFNSGARFGFCDLFAFRGFKKTAKIKEVSSYVIRTN